MRFTTFVSNCELIKSKLEAVDKEVKTLNDANVIENLTDIQVNRLKLLATAATRKNDEFEKHISKLFTSLPSDGKVELEKITEYQNVISELYWNILSTCNTLLPAEASSDNKDVSLNSSTNTHTQPSSNVRLPPINVPTFSGEPEQWITFQNIFENSIHKNESISNVEKFTYLLSCLANEPLSLIKSLPINNTNYVIAWQTLVNRYHNTRLLVTLHTNNILDLPQLQKPNTKQLREFVAVFNENSQALSSLGHNIANENLILTSHILRKLDPSFRSEFERSRPDSKQIPDIKELIKFIEDECCQREATSLTSISSSQQINAKNSFGFKNPAYQNKTSATGLNTKPPPSRHVMFSTNQTQSQTCKYCNSSSHNIYQCNEFSSLTPQSRHAFIKNKSLCQNCFGTHKKEFCKSIHSCKECNKRHHSLLHFTFRPTANSTDFRFSKPKPEQDIGLQKGSGSNEHKRQSVSNEAPVSTLSCGTTFKHNSTVLLATTMVKLFSENGHSCVVRAVLDSGSQATLISEHCANLLHLPRSHFEAPDITGISSTAVKPRGIVHLGISSLCGQILIESQPVLVLSSISNNLPRAKLSKQVKDRLKSFTLADPSFDVPGPIELLIGADLYAKTTTSRPIGLGDNMPYAVNTIFGYVVLGYAPLALQSNNQFTGLSTLLSTNDLDLHATLQRFWSLEEPPPCNKTSPQNAACEKHFSDTHSRDSTGRYICRLPFQQSPAKLGISSTVAKQTFHALERKFSTQPEFKDTYTEFMSDYKSCGHMELCEAPPSSCESSYFLPHHGVFKNNKIRVVFNASAITSNGTSLNSLLHQGPKLHNDIPDIIFRFRQHRIVFLCDIKQMFRQILIHKDDQNYQLIYWREDASLPLEIYRLTTVTFGMSSSPFIANRVIQQLINDEGKNHPLAAKALRHQVYVDDAILGSDSIEEAIALQHDVVDLLKKGGFELRKWSANYPELLQNLPREHCDSPLMFRASGQPCLSVLGLKWLSESDEFSYMTSKPSTHFTKRTVLSAIAQIYDPLGWVSPVVFFAKAIMQHLWTLGLQWDDPLPEDVLQRWSAFVEELPSLEKIVIPRHIDTTNAIKIDLHGFCDASEAGYAACTYLRVESPNNEISVFLLIAKSRVAPLKRISLPRLELCGAHLLTHLLKYSSEQLLTHLEINCITAWCDSTITLAWIQTPAYRLKTYVSNRVAQIQDLMPTCIWKHVSSHENAADPASRGLTASHLFGNELWWKGPPWLKLPSSSWTYSNENVELPIEDELPELRTTTLNLMTQTSESTGLEFITKYSSWTTLLHVMGYVLRFIYCLKNRKKVTNPFSRTELELSNQRICYLIQMSHLKYDIELLEKKKMCSNRVQRLAPFLDAYGILRVGGRLKYSNLSFAAKHQIVLPKNHPTVHLLIDYYHKINLHAGPQFLQSALQEKYWILSARSIIRSRIFQCVRCFKAKPKINSPLMADLPADRVTPTRCFNISGVDYAGPFRVKLYRLRKIQLIKVYLCLFICFTSKSVHLEIVTDLSTDTFIASLTRFISRRGLVSDLYSDCGTNFIGTSSSLRRTFEELMKRPETQRFAEGQIRFHFIPPRSPHQGGLWERAVKSAKFHLTRVIGEQILTYEEFLTLTARVEAMLNSRPITPISSDPNDLQPLTPGHFLTGGPLISLIEPDLSNSNPLQRWKLVQAFAQRLWLRWKKDYLQTLQARSKWTTKEDNLQVGDLVIVHEEHSPPLTWKMGRITAVSPGKDGIVRVVHLRTSTGSLTRSAVKVSRLPIT